MQAREIIGMKEEIDRLWEELSKIREESGSCGSSPQKEKVIQLMHRLARQGEEGRKFVLEKIVKIRWRLASMQEAERDWEGAKNQLGKAQGLLDDHKEIDQSLRSWIGVDLRRIKRRCRDGNEGRTEGGARSTVLAGRNLFC